MVVDQSRVNVLLQTGITHHLILTPPPHIHLAMLQKPPYKLNLLKAPTVNTFNTQSKLNDTLNKTNTIYN